MPFTPLEFWTEHLRQTLQRYDTGLLRAVAGKLVKPRNQWPVEELIDRSLDAISNAAIIDRRLNVLEPAGRRLLALIGHSRQPRWRVGNLVEMLIALGHSDGLQPIRTVLEAGLLYPDLLPGSKVKSFEQWLGHSAGGAPAVFAHPHVTSRALGEDLGLPSLLTPYSSAVPHEADGLEWPLRLVVLWQDVSAAPLRRTQQGDLFKRDLERLTVNAILNSPLSEGLADLPDIGLLAVALGQLEGVLEASGNELRAVGLPSCWQVGLLPALESLWAAWPWLDAWEPNRGGRAGSEANTSNPYSSASLLSLLLLARLPEDAWADPAEIERWIEQHHPYWSPLRGAGSSSRSSALSTPHSALSPVHSAPSAQPLGLSIFLLGIAFSLRIVQAAKNAEEKWLVRLSPVGRWLLGIGPAPSVPAAFPQTLLVQPNLEIVAYRQGLTPELIAALSWLALWKNLGPACTLQLQPDTIYRALEAGQTFETIRQALERHATRELPATVLDSLRTWSNKRERLAVYPSATLFEFATPEDLNEALARGLSLTRLSERWAVAGDGQVDFRHFRLTGTRDYGLPPAKCVEVGEDGVTLCVDLARSDLLVETELQRFAESEGVTSLNDRRQYRLTPASLTAARESGWALRALDDWFMQRTGQPLPPAGRLLLTAALLPPAEFRKQLVLHVPTADVADGLLQWPGTRGLIEARLGPTALAVAEEHVDSLRQMLQSLGLAERA